MGNGFVYAMLPTVLLCPTSSLQVSPLPNIPIYYSGWRCWVHYRAWRGAQSLQSLVLNVDRRQLVKLRSKLLELQAAGHHFEEGSWPADLLSRSNRQQPSNSPLFAWPTSAIPRMLLVRVPWCAGSWTRRG